MLATSETSRPLVIGLFVALFALGGFVLIALQVNPTVPFEIDIEVAQEMRAFSQKEHYFGYVMIGLTTIGSVWVIAPMAMAIAVWGFARRQPLLVAAWVLIPAGGAACNQGLKVMLDRERPPVDWRDPFVHEVNLSFPSGHAMGSTIGFGLLGYTILRVVRSRPKRWMIVIGLGLLVVGIGLSRVYLRAHWLSDVIAGFLAGTAWLGLCLGVVESYRLRNSPPSPRIAVNEPPSLTGR